MSSNNNPLSTAQGVKIACELCGKVAYMKCEDCTASFYCSKEHQQLDYESIHSKICNKMSLMRTMETEFGSEEGRERQKAKAKQMKHALMDMTQNEALKYIYSRNFEYTIPTALQSLRFAVEIYGKGSIDTASSYLLLGEAFIGLGRFDQAEDNLALAKWTILKSTETRNDIKSQLHRNFGLLYAAKGKYNEAIKELANDIYYCSLNSGPEHITTATAYFNLAHVLVQIGKSERALALLAKVSEIWYKYLTTSLTDPEFNDGGLNDVKAIEALNMLRNVLELREAHLGASHPTVGESYHVLGMLHVYLEDYNMGLEYVDHAVTIFESEFGESHPSTMEATKLRTLVAKTVEQLDE